MQEPENNETVFNENSDSEATLHNPSFKALRQKTYQFRPVLICLEGPHRGMRYYLQKRDNIIGRGQNADIHLDDVMISRQHARIVWHTIDSPGTRPRCVVEDLGSRNGTELNGAPLECPTELREHDRLLLGATVLGFFLRDADELELDRTLYELATKDALTGLDNRHQFNALLRHNLERVRRYGHRIVLLLIDADHFKIVNDTYGHDVGDLALKHLAQIVATSCRTTEVCARWGGEEFTILAQESDAEGAIVLAERIRSRVVANPLEWNGVKIPLSVSIGVTVLKADDTPEEAFHRADHSLLMAKELGRNRIVIESQPYGLDETATFTKRPPAQSQD
jgi:diguanylate cyclase (GGDEF)-like protein